MAVRQPIDHRRSWRCPAGPGRNRFHRSCRGARRTLPRGALVELGAHVERGDVVARIYDTFGKKLGDIRSKTTGMVIGHTQHPLVNRGDAIVHIAAIVDESEESI